MTEIAPKDLKFLKLESQKCNIDENILISVWKEHFTNQEFVSTVYLNKQDNRKRYCKFIDRNRRFCKTGVKGNEEYCKRHLSQAKRNEENKKKRMAKKLDAVKKDIIYNNSIEQKQVNKYNEFIDELRKSGEL